MQTEIPRLAFNEIETGKILGVSSRTVFSLRAAGKIGFVKLAEGKKSRVLYPLASIEKYLAENTSHHTAFHEDSSNDLPLPNQKIWGGK